MSSMKEFMQTFAVNQALKYIEGDPNENQPFNDNMLHPCPMLENPEALRAMVKATGAVNTGYQSPESVDHLCGKTTPYAENWKLTADRLWGGTCASETAQVLSPVIKY